MLPAYRPGQIVVALRKRPRRGDVVVFMHQNLEKIKRVHEVREADVYLLGDNPGESIDSRSFGWLPMEAISGVVIWPRRKSFIPADW
jgi:phage repressor protein C with HTH and peptisase S24 domain